jgi:hypothetical protein
MDYIKEIVDNVNQGFFKTSLLSMATVYIQGDPIGEESIHHNLIMDNFDSREGEPLRFHYPEDLEPSYRIKTFVIERQGLRASTQQQYEYRLVGHNEPYDIWISCRKSDILVKTDRTVFDFADNVSFEGIKYIVKAVVNEGFGNKPIVHVFLKKETS